MKFFKLAFTFLRIGILNELQYRVNFFVQLLQSFISLSTGLIGLSVVFNQVEDLGGWTRPELLAVMGIHILMGGIIHTAVQPNMERIMNDIRNGTLDFALTKPADAQALVSVREFRFWHLVDVGVGLIVLVFASVQINSQVGLTDVLAFIGALFMGAVMFYCVWLIITATAFWIIRVDEIANLFEGLYAAGRWPVGIYPDWLKTGLTFIIPVAFAVTVPAEALTSRLTPSSLWLALGVTLGLFVFTRFIWRLGLRNYSGASA